MERHPQQNSRFPADLDARIATLGRRLREGRRIALRAWQVVGHAETSDDLVTVGLVHCAKNDLVQMDIGPDTELAVLITELLWVVSPGRGSGYPGNRAVQQPRVYQNSGGALCRTGTACEFEVPLGVGNSLTL